MCDELTDTCTNGIINLTHACDIGSCLAECDSTCPSTECDNLDGCVGNDYYDYDNVSNSCLDCSCESKDP